MKINFLWYITLYKKMNIIYPKKLTKYIGGITEKDNFYQYFNKTKENFYTSVKCKI